MKNVIVSINDKILEIQSTEVVNANQKVAQSLRLLRLNFLKSRIKRKEISETDPIVDIILKEKKYVY